MIGALLMSLLSSFVLVQGASAAPQAPFTDSSANGYIGLCNQQGQQITSGSIDTIPFAWKAVSSVAAESNLAGSGRTATLYAFQPIDGIDAEDWSGEQLTGTSQYSDPSHPMVVATTRDYSLASFLTAFPTVWDGFLELRMILDAPGQSPYVQSYPALDLYVSGDTWQAVGGGTVDCNAGQAVSDEEIIPTTTTAQSGSVTQPTSSSSAGGSSNGAGADPKKVSTGASGGTGKQSSDSAGSSSSSPASRSDGGNGESGNSQKSSGSKGSATADVRALPVLHTSKNSDVMSLVAAAVAAVVLLMLPAGIAIGTRRRRAYP
jgi:hypothetical protein